MLNLRFLTLLLKHQILLPMGLDGGNISSRPDMVKVVDLTQERRTELERAAEYSHSFWTTCGLTGSPLKSNILVSRKGTLFDKESVLSAICDDTIPPRLSYLKHVKKLVTLDLRGAANLISYVCPISNQSPSPGTNKIWKVISPCGHLFTEESLLVLPDHKCPICGHEYTEKDLITLSTVKRTDKVRENLSHPINKLATKPS